jgi:hypothetical protein
MVAAGVVVAGGTPEKLLPGAVCISMVGTKNEICPPSVHSIDSEALRVRVRDYRNTVGKSDVDCWSV